MRDIKTELLSKVVAAACTPSFKMQTNLDIHYLISGKSICNCQYTTKKGSQHLYTKF
jgi:hypothetical protein